MVIEDPSENPSSLGQSARQEWPALSNAGPWRAVFRVLIVGEGHDSGAGISAAKTLKHGE